MVRMMVSIRCSGSGTTLLRQLLLALREQIDQIPFKLVFQASVYDFDQPQLHQALHDEHDLGLGDEQSIGDCLKRELAVGKTENAQFPRAQVQVAVRRR